MLVYADNIVHSCVNDTTYQVRIPPVGFSCPPGWHALDWVRTHAAGACADNANRYVNCGNGTVTDTKTQLIWLQNANCFGRKDYATAIQAASALAEGQRGLTDGSSPGDWRLPTIGEWNETISRAYGLGCKLGGPGGPPSLTNDPGIDCLKKGPTSFIGVQSDGYWTSEGSEDIPTFAVYFGLDTGDNPLASKDSTYFVWPVRSP